MSDLISFPRALVVFTPPLTVDQQATIPPLITAASRAVERYCRRQFFLATYDEVRTPRSGQWDRGEPDYVGLRYFPVQAIERVAGARTPTLMVTNLDPATNQRAIVAPILDGDPEIQQTTLGLNLIHVASAVRTVIPLLYADLPTVGAVVGAINAQGNGWHATVQPGLEAWAADDLVGIDGPSGALAGSVTLDVFRQDIAAYRVDTAGGGLYMAATTATAGGPGAPWFWPQSSGMDFLAGSWRPEVRVTYVAGWPTVPEPVQQACAITVQQMYYDQVLNNMLKSETMGEYSYTLDESLVSIPASARDLLGPYRLYRF